MIEKVLQGVEMREGEIDHVVLIGGSTRIPKIRELVASYGEVSAGIDPYMGVGRWRRHAQGSDGW